MKDITRVQLDIPNSRIEGWEKLQERCALTTRKDLIESALALFEWCVEQAEAGRAIISIDDKTGRQREIVMPALRSLKQRKP